MSTVNYHTFRSSNLAALNAIVLNVSTLTGSTIQTTATATTSSIVVSTLTTRSATYSTLTGSTITTSSIITPVIATATGFTTIGQNTSFPNRSIEIGSDAANSVYFDFHSSDSVYADYSTRIQSLGGSTIGQGHMMIQGSTINILGTSGVGIGTSAPGNVLHVYGASSPAIGIGNSTAANFFQIGAASFVGSYSASAVAGDAIIRTTSGNLMLQTGTGAAAVYVNTSNNIILNYNASSPSTYKLCVEQGLSNNNGILISNSNYGSPQQFQLSMVNAGSGNFYSFAIIQTNTSGVAAAVPLCLQPNSANVGIGTTAPTGKCHIYGNGQSTGLSDVYSLNISSPDSFNGDGGRTVYSESINLKAGDLIWNPAVRVYGARIYIGGGYSINGAQNQGVITMFTGNTERVRVSESGNVGIGTNAPNSKMDIRGGTAGVVYWANPVLNVYGNTDFDASNVVNIQCQASQYGRNILYMTGRYEGSNDAWSFGTGRNMIMFQTQSSLNSAATQRFQIQNFANQLGILSNGKGSTPITVWNDNGNVGIGVANPSYLLQIDSISNVYNLAGYLGSGGYGNYGNNSITNATSLYISGWGMTAAAWGVTSDRRIKTNIEPVSNILSIINQINVVKYDYIDPRLGREECSVIAQELQEVFPNAINISTDYLPNIMKLCTYTRQDTIITLSVSLQSTPDNLNDIKVGSILKLLISNDDQKEKEITTPILSISFTDHTIQVSSWEDYSDTSTVIVYGTQVDNYLSIDKPQLGVMALQGVKELVKQNADLQAIIDTQAAQIATILARLNAAGIA